MSKANIAVMGAGAWGRNIVRTVAELGYLAAVCDPSTDCLEAARRLVGEKAKDVRWTSLKAPMICSSLNRLLFIGSAPSRGPELHFSAVLFQEFRPDEHDYRSSLNWTLVGIPVWLRPNV